MCKCSSIDLLNYGCRCGQIDDEPCSLWFNGQIYIVAQSQAHASLLAQQQASNLQWLVGDGQGWRQIADDQILTFEFDDKSNYTLTASAWADIYGPGYLATR